MRRFIHLLALVMGALCVSCASSTPQLYEAVGSDDAAVNATSTLLQDGKIKAPQAKVVYDGAVGAESALKVWDSGIQNGSSTTAIAVDTQNALQAVAGLLTQLQAIQGSTAQLRAGASLKRYRVPAKAAAISPSEVIDLAELAVQLSPTIESWVNTIFSAETATQTQVTAEFATLDTDLISLANLINGVSVPAVPTPLPTTP